MRAPERAAEKAVRQVHVQAPERAAEKAADLRVQAVEQGQVFRVQAVAEAARPPEASELKVEVHWADIFFAIRQDNQAAGLPNLRIQFHHLGPCTLKI